MFKDLYITYRNAFRIRMRRRGTPMTDNEAAEKRLFWAKCYVMCSLSIMLYTTYKVFQNNSSSDTAEGNPKESYLDTLAKKKRVKFIKFEGFRKVDEYMYDPVTIKKEPQMNNSTEEKKDSIVTAPID